MIETEAADGDLRGGIETTEEEVGSWEGVAGAKALA